MSYYDDVSGLNFYYYGEDDAPAGTGKGSQIFADVVDAARASGEKFVDPFFPPTKAQFGTYKDLTNQELVWKRPTKIANDLFGTDPVFHGEFCQFDIEQGGVGDCWFLSTLADAATKPDCINTLVPEDNTEVGWDSGAFHFRFWNRGKWVDVVVDDLLACNVDQNGKVYDLALAKPTKTGGFWPCLLEKAYAKLYGGYDKIDGAPCTVAMEDFTGGFIEQFLRDDPKIAGDKLQTVIESAIKNKSLITFATIPTPDDMKVKTPGKNPGDEIVSIDGMVGGHAYSILDIKDVIDKNDGHKTTLVKLRNPWGDATEWKGNWSDPDPNGTWQTVTTDLRTGNPRDGQFWMAMEDLQRLLDVIYTCRWSGKFRGDETIPLPGGISFVAHGNFAKGNCGSLPQGPWTLIGKSGYYLHLKTSESNKDQGELINGECYNCGLSVNLMYKNYTCAGSSPDNPSYGFYILRAPGHHVPNEEFFKGLNNDNFVMPLTFQKEDRQAYYHTDLPEGTICIFPWIQYEADSNEQPFLLRIMAEATEVLEIPLE